MYFPAGSQTEERAQIRSLLTQLAEYAISHKANILVGGDWNAVTSGVRRCGYRTDAPRQDRIFAEWLHTPIGPPDDPRF